MHFWKSFIVIAILCAAVIVSISLIYGSFFVKKSSNIKARVIAAITVLCTIASILFLGKYTNPYDQTLEYEQFLIIETDSPHSLVAGQRFWHGAYAENVFHAGPLFYSTESFKARYGDNWPELDFSHYSYIITYGQEMTSLSYNVWNTIDVPVYTGVYAGRVELSDEFDPCKIYIYQISKLPIDNYP